MSRRRRRRSSSKRPAGLNKQADALKLARVAPARLPSLLWPGLAAAGKLARGSGRSSRASLFPANKLRLAGRRSASSARAPLPIRVLDFQQQQPQPKLSPRRPKTVSRSLSKQSLLAGQRPTQLAFGPARAGCCNPKLG